MAFAVVQKVHVNNNAVGTSLAASGAVVGSGNAVVGSFSIDSSGGGDIVSVTDDKGNTYTVVDNVNDATNVQRFCSFVLGNITNGPATITVGSTSKSFRTVTWEEISGVAALSDPRDGHGGQLQTAPGTSSNGVTSGSVTTTVNGDLIWGATCNSSDGTVPSVGSGFAAGTGDSDGAIIVTENRTQTTAGAVAATFTAASNVHFITLVMALKAADGGGAEQHFHKAPRSAEYRLLILQRMPRRK